MMRISVILVVGLFGFVLLDHVPFRWSDCEDYAPAKQGTKMMIGRMKRLRETTVDKCKAECTKIPECGGFTFVTTVNKCTLQKISSGLIEEYLTPSIWFSSFKNYDWYSKGDSCPWEEEHTDKTCDVYRSVGSEQIMEHFKEVDGERVYDYQIDSAWNSAMTLDECKKWCTIYGSCTSIRYVNTGGQAVQCYLYYTTIGEIKENGEGKDIKDGGQYSTSYDRYCKNGNAYKPIRVSEETPTKK